MSESQTDLDQKDLEIVTSVYKDTIIARNAYTSFVNNMLDSIKSDLDNSPITWMGKRMCKYSINKLTKIVNRDQKVFDSLCDEILFISDRALVGEVSVEHCVICCERATRLFKLLLVQVTVAYTSLHTTLKQASLSFGGN